MAASSSGSSCYPRDPSISDSVRHGTASGHAKPYQCPKCPMRVNTAPGLKIHITKKHRDDVVDVTLPTPADTLSGLPASSPDNVSTTEEVPLEELFGSLKSDIRILRRIPKGARGSAATVLADSMAACLAEGSPTSWRRLLLFAALCLRVPQSQTAPHRTSLTTQVKRQLAAFAAGGSTHPPFERGANGITTRPRPDFSRCVQAKLADGDVRGAIRILGSEDVFAPTDANTLEDLRKLHPRPSSLEAPLPSVDDPRHVPLQVSLEEVKGAINSFHAGSAGGIDLLRPQHLKDLTGHAAGAAGARLLTVLTALCNRMLAGGVPEEIRPILYGAALYAFKKKSGGIRPIAVGCTYRRLASKLCSFRLNARLGHSFHPVQLGFGSKHGVEIATHATRRFVHFQHRDPQVLLKIDFCNAFNSIHRSSILRAVSSMAPELFHYVCQSYGSPSHLFFGDNIIPSARGVQQGDPLGPALFCMVTQPLFQSLRSPLNVWYLDDGTMGGDPRVVLQDFQALQVGSRDHGLEIQITKTELFGMGAPQAIISEMFGPFLEEAPALRLPPLDECTELGTPLFKNAIAGHILEKIHTLKIISGRLSALSSQSALYILKHSQGLPKLVHLLRCAPTWLCPQELQLYDSILRDTLSSITNIALSPDAWTQSSWPVALGGLGIRHSFDLAVPAFLSSTLSTADSVLSILPPIFQSTQDDCLQAGLEAWSLRTNAPAPEGDLRKLQSAWESPLMEDSRRSQLDLATKPIDRARLVGVASSASGAFLDALPSPHLGTTMDNNSFRIAVALRLGAPICQAHICSCSVPVQEDGLHGLSCRRSAGRQPRHASVNDLIQRALSSAGVPSSLEPSHLSLSNNLRPDGVSRIPWRNGKILLWDYTCTDGLAPSHVEHSAVTPLYAASKAEDIKRAKYHSLLSSHHFIPVSSECLGSFGGEGEAFLREIGRRITATTGEKRATAYLFQRVSVAIQLGNAIAIQGSLPKSDSLEECLGSL